jgi:hypothetical protein
MKKRLLMLVLGLVLVNTGMVEGAPNPWTHQYPTLLSQMSGTWRAAQLSWNQDLAGFEEIYLGMEITKQDQSGQFYGSIWGLPVDMYCTFTGSIDTNNQVTINIIGDAAGIGATAILARFDGKLSGAGKKLTGTMSLSVQGDSATALCNTYTGKVLFTVPPPD